MYQKYYILEYESERSNGDIANIKIDTQEFILEDALK